MNLRTRTWMLISLLCFGAAWVFWQLGEKRRLRDSPPPAFQPPKSNELPRASGPSPRRAVSPPAPAATTATPTPFGLLSLAKDPRFPHRLSNTRKAGDDMFRNDNAVLLRHAWIETTEGPPARVPDHLRAGANPGSYIVQARGPIDVAFRDALVRAGATIVSYVPNNAYLVAASPELASRLTRWQRAQAVLPFEPYYKFSTELIGDAVGRVPQPIDRELNVVLFPNATTRVAEQFASVGAEPLQQQNSPFGPVVTVRAGGEAYIALARMPEVQLIEVNSHRVQMNDLMRERIGVATNTITTLNFLNLTGNGVRVGVNDSGVQGTHSELTGRVFVDAGNVGADTDLTGHGTHVAGTLGGSGAGSASVTVNYGTVAGAQFRGMAPSVRMYPQDIFSLLTDEQLQTNAARTNIYIVCNAWGRQVYEYDIFAASWDAATRDALPYLPGDQQTTYIFSAGNDGNGNVSGSGGIPSTITSPGSAKNVITVGAIEQLRLIITTNGFVDGLTDTREQVCDFSARGNVGLGVEGLFGRFKPDVVAPGAFVLSARSTGFTNPSPYVAALDATMNPSGIFRFESGTSMAAAGVSGMLALMQEYFAGAPYSRTNSPALNKALLINGTRSASLTYNRQVQSQVNYQGWGLVQFTNSIPSNVVASSAIQFVDQSPTNAVATGDVRIYRVTVNNPNAALTTNFPLRVTLAWTDPPGNPAVGPKLVNNLDLVVSNTVSANAVVFEGNNIPGGSDFTSQSLNGTAPLSDIINNVENVFIQAPLPVNVFDIYVIGRRVNVNAVTGNSNNIVQDFALVVSTDYPNSITLAQQPSIITNTVLVNLTNGLPLLNQPVGANSPTSNVPNGLYSLVGSTNQWRFFVFSNVFIPSFTNITTNFFVGTTNFVTNVINTPITNGSNVAITVFLPPNLARARLNGQADLDLYVTRGDPSITNLNPAAISNCLALAPGYFAATNRGGNEVFTFSPASASDVFYIGVKSEDQQGGLFNIAALSTDRPFNSTNGNAITVNFIGLPMDIPDGSPDAPSGITLFGFCLVSTNVSSFNITNVLAHENLGDLVGTLTHNGISVVLNNHSIGTNFAGGYVTNRLTYDDYLNPPDGPGFPTDFVGVDALGLWLLTFVDSALEHTGRVVSVDFVLNAATNSATNVFNLFSNQCVVVSTNIPVGATNLIINVQQSSSASISLDFYAAFGYVPTRQSNDFNRIGVSTNFVFNISTLSTPPLRPGPWFFQFCNTTPNTNQITVSFQVEFDFTTVASAGYDARAPVTLLDDYRTNVYITNFDNRIITGIEVGVELDTPRGSDYALYVRSPLGRRVLLYENRGGTNPGLFANFTEDTNKQTVEITGTGPITYRTYGSIVPIKWIRPPFTNLLSPPQFVNSNLHRFSTSPNSSNTAAALAFRGNSLVMAGQLTNTASYGDGQLIYYRTPVTNNAVSRLAYTNWPGILGGGRNGSTLFHGAAMSAEGVFLAGQTKDYFPTPQAPSGGAAPDIYDLDTGCTNGTLTITYQFFTVPDQMTIYYQGVLVTNTGMVSNGPPGGPFPTQTFSVNFAGSNSFIRIIMNEFTGNAGTAWNYNVAVACANLPAYSWGTPAGAVLTSGYVDSASGPSARFNQPHGVALDLAGTAYIGDTLNHVIRTMTTATNVGTLAGTGVSGFANGAALAAQFNRPRGVAVSNNTAVLVADELNHRIRVVSGGVVSTLAGTGVPGFANGAAGVAQFQNPYGVALDTAGNVYVADRGNHRIRMIDAAGNVSTFAGTGVAGGTANGNRLVITLNNPSDIVYHPATGFFYIADTGNGVIRRVDGAGFVTVIGPAMTSPECLTVDAGGSIYVSETGGHRIRKITPSGLSSIIGGTGVAGSANGSPGQFNFPRGVAVRPDFNLVVADSINHTLRNTTTTIGMAKDKGIVVNYPSAGPATNGAAGNGAVYLSRVITNNVFGVDGNDRLRGVMLQAENGTNFIYAIGSAENTVGTNRFFIAKARTNGAGLWIAVPNPAGLPAFSATNRLDCEGFALTSIYGTNIVGVGYSNVLGANVSYLAIVSTNGTVNLSTTAGGPGVYYGVAVVNSNIFAVGTSSTNTGGACIVDKFQLNGAFVDRLTVDLSASFNDTLFGVVGAGCSGRLYAVGVRSNSAANSDGILLEINPGAPATAGTMVVLSTNIVSVSGNTVNAATAVATDGNDLYVAGNTDSGSLRDMFLYRYRIKNWYQPEESLNLFIGESTRVTNGAVIDGAWSLEIWDNRINNATPAPRLLCWNLNFNYAPLGSGPGIIAPGPGVTPVLLSKGPQYFAVQTPFSSTRATNTVTGSGRVKIIYNALKQPLPGAVGNVTLGTLTNGGSIVLTTSGASAFKPGERYFIGLVPDEGAADGTLGVGFDFVDAPPVPSLGNGLTSTSTLANGPALAYWQFNVPAGASGALFELTPSNGNLDLYIRKARPGPASSQISTTQYDYRSINVGSRADQILLVPGTGVVPLASGTWYVAVANADSKPVTYGLRATSFGGAPYSVVPLSSGVFASGASPPGNAPATMFKLAIPTNTPSALFQVTSLSGSGDLILRKGAYPTASSNDFASLQPGTLMESVVVRTNTSRPTINGDWFVGVVNRDPYHINYAVLARLPQNGILVSAAPIVLPNARPAPTFLTNRHFGFDLGGLPGEKYRVEFTTNFTTWTPLTTYVAAADGSVSFVHTNALTNRNFYYRIQQVP
jgi:sugar lactone lactonase YvrE